MFCNKTFSFNLHNYFIFTLVLDNLCQNALNLTNGNGKLIVDNNRPIGTYCQWLISAKNENSYITLQFQNINVSQEIYCSEKFILLKSLGIFQIDHWFNRLDIYDGPDELSIKIGEAYGNSNNKLLKSISSSGKSLLIDFKKQYKLEENEMTEFEVSINYNKTMSVCQTWLDVKKNTLISPNYPNNSNCSWVITSNLGSYIILNFEFIEVYILKILSNFDQLQIINLIQSNSPLIITQVYSGLEYVNIYEGGSEYADLVRNFTGIYKQTNVSVAGNQMFVKFETSSTVAARRGFRAYIHRIGINLTNRGHAQTT